MLSKMGKKASVIIVEMIKIFDEKATKEEVKNVTEAYEDYTKVVVDIKKEIMAAGGEYHIDCEQLLIANGSSQENLWGGGFRFTSSEVDFMALTNYKPGIGHFTYEIGLPEVRKKVEKVTRGVFENE